jgi:2-methylcitrate dehydratase PrpD
MTNQATEGPTPATALVEDRDALTAALRELGRFVVDHTLPLPNTARRAALDLVLIDTLGAMVAGARTPELEALVGTFTDPGPARPRGMRRRLAVADCAFLDGISACVLELDEGNKHARGHPAAHVLPVVLALGSVLPVPAHELVTAFAAGHEISARFGRAVRLTPGLHPHGNWGVAGAAAAAARLLGCDAEGVAGAIDAAAGLALASPFDAALRGTFVRNTYLGATAVAGLQAARLAQAGLTEVAGTASPVFGKLLGTLNVGALTDQLGSRFDIQLGYLKRHASCSYTHPPIDAVLDLRARYAIDPASVVGIHVRTHRLAAPLDHPEPTTRLAAMFSIPHLVAAALVYGRVDVEATGSEARRDKRVRALAARVRVAADPTMDARAPAERPAGVRITLSDGTCHDLEVPNPVGDSDFHPLDRAAVRAKLTAIIGEERTSRIEAGVDAVHLGATTAEDFVDALP